MFKHLILFSSITEDLALIQIEEHALYLFSIQSLPLFASCFVEPTIRNQHHLNPSLNQTVKPFLAIRFGVGLSFLN